MASPEPGTMICRCSPEGIADADARLERCRTALGNPAPGDFLSALVMELSQGYGAWISWIAADQWFGVSVGQLRDGRPQRLLFECDRVEDGLAAAWEFLSKTCSGGEAAEVTES